ncbi:hypothetical protein F2P56_034832 [Juglans regia]|uniref:Uncharacterized protein At5g08430 isoform X2 n=2 Tax=Juglans regia TaxID=51240 RepID=A0A6P9E2I2_JUGRE|nr:uncharacterized protein At5g08430 isoform X2 [Juglans regia]XP_035542281.1 uncharacterized protein At5g08430 isoform X2 [Juglans regia]KAF5442142.1 hypothetical protein F2P56_034832 [Juglans regia]
MAGRVESAPFDWMEENSVHQYETPVRTKRKVRSKKKEFLGWGSRQLIEFLESIGKDTSEHISQYDAAAIINDYVNNNHLLHPTKKKRILCDERLHSIFGRKTVSRIKIHDLLEPHFAENLEESDEVFSYSSDERENVLETYERDNISSMERAAHQKKKVSVTPTSCFAALNLHNIKLVYLRKSLVEDLLKDPETFEDKLVGSFVRIKSDPNDYLQKNSHQLVQVTGIKKAFGIGSTSMEVLLQVSGVVKDICVGMLSDDNFSGEECKDLNQRVKDGLLKRPTVVELQHKAQILHEDITKHWLAREIPLLQNLIDRANEKGWRRELDQYLEKKQLLETPDEQSRLLHEVPKVNADEVEPEATPKDILDNVEQGNNGSPRSILNGASEVPFRIIAANGAASTWTCQSTDFAEFQNDVIEEQPKQPSGYIDKSNGETQLANIERNNQVIDLSDDEEKEEPSVGKRIPDDQLGSLLWHYLDPQGEIQGPFSLTSLKRWSDAYYFPPDFKVWKTGQNQDEAVLLKNILH